MKKIAVAEIFWYTGTIINYGANRISPILVLDNYKNQVEGAYSSVVLNKKYISENKTLAYVSFLAPSAPYDLLKGDERFSLFDGIKKIGEGIIKKVIFDDFINSSGKWLISNDVLE